LRGLWASVLYILFLVCLVAALASIVVRFRRAGVVERQQLKWFTFAGTMVTIVGFGDFGGDVVLAAGIASFPVAAGIAILKYRLYDIDVIINRTLVYGALSVVLAVVYGGGVFGIGGLLRSVTGQENNSLAVAASTLAVAALFRPARTRVQNFIDRRFFRRKYDAVKTLDTFTAKLRDEVDLEAMRAELVAAVSETMQPTHASLWLRETASR
jgi:hypothetical protein